MKYLIYLLFFLLAFGQLGRISFFEQQVNIYPHEIIMIIVIISQIGVIRRIREIGEWREIFFFLGILLLSLINDFWKFSFLQNFVGFLYWARLGLYFSFFLVLYYWKDKKKKETLEKGLMVFTFLTIIFSYLQYFLYPNLRNLYYLGWDPHQFRVFGFFFDTSVTGVIFLILFFWLAEIGPIRPIRLIGQIGLIGLILLTYSRITYLSFIVGLTYYFKNKLFSKKIFIFYFLFFILIFLLPRPFGEGVKLERIFTIQARLNDYKEGLELWLKKPILGWGYNRLRYVKNTDNFSHSGASFSSSFLTILVASGVIGLIGLVGLIGKLVRRGKSLAKTIVLVVVTASFFDNILFTNFVLFLVLILFLIDYG